MIDPLDVERLFTETIAVFGGVDVVVHAAPRGSSVIDQQAARWLRHGGAIVHVAHADAMSPALADELRVRNITISQVALFGVCENSQRLDRSGFAVGSVAM